MRYWISYRKPDAADVSSAMEQSDTPLGAYLRATVLSDAGGLKIKIRDADTFQSWDVEAFAARHGLAHP